MVNFFGETFFKIIFSSLFWETEHVQVFFFKGNNSDIKFIVKRNSIEETGNSPPVPPNSSQNLEFIRQ